MSDKSKIRTPEEKVRKMLDEEKTIVDLELAIKKEKFRKTQEPKEDDWNWVKKDRAP